VLQHIKSTLPTLDIQLHQLYEAMMMITGSLLISISNVKWFQVNIVSPVKIFAKNVIFGDRIAFDTYRKNSNIIRTIFTKNTGPVARVHIIHVN